MKKRDNLYDEDDDTEEEDELDENLNKLLVVE